ncbi:hypothetical protein DPMN_016806 [Dreissena polymorpha]|uniref:Uncharacterized protein n=1 Tax=Dreissena polymorpha TaxID=45954 RepID=A0A9D4S7I6_DREPO|nr:hypothetical protein DPMN_016806 [Dreissena polymorpha]
MPRHVSRSHSITGDSSKAPQTSEGTNEAASCQLVDHILVPRRVRRGMSRDHVREREAIWWILL